MILRSLIVHLFERERRENLSTDGELTRVTISRVILRYLLEPIIFERILIVLFGREKNR